MRLTGIILLSAALFAPALAPSAADAGYTKRPHKTAKHTAKHKRTKVLGYSRRVGGYAYYDGLDANSFFYDRYGDSPLPQTEEKTFFEQIQTGPNPVSSATGHTF